MNLFPDPLKCSHEFIRQFATDAPAFQFDVTLAGLVPQQGLVDSQVTEFIRHDRDPHPLGLCLFKQVPNERGFTGTQESGHDQCRNASGRQVIRRFLVLKR